MKEDGAIRLKTLEQENSRLKRIAAEQNLDISTLKDSSKGTSVPGPSARCGGAPDEAVSGEQALRMPTGRAAPIEQPVPAGAERHRNEPVARMTKLAEEHPKWGNRMIHALLVEEGWPVNKKRIELLWRQEGRQLPAEDEFMRLVLPTE